MCQMTLSRDINIIYMHMRGVLDNFAWCFLYEKEPSAKLSPMDIGLFSEKFKKLLSFSEIKEEISKHADWNREVKDRRDPVAHRIPLYIPPSVLQKEEEELYRELVSEYKFEQLNDLGSFYPCFEHHPEQGTIPIYPTIPIDIAHLIVIGDTIEHSLSPN